jgi:hypothetical protein
MNILARADAVAEDKIYSVPLFLPCLCLSSHGPCCLYQAANSPNRSVGMVDAYRNLTSLRGNFELLIDTVSPPPLSLLFAVCLGT